VLDGRCKRNENVLTIEAGVKREEVRRLYACVGVFECSYGSFMRKGRISDKNNRKTEDAEVPSEDERTPPADGSRNEFNEKASCNRFLWSYSLQIRLKKVVREV
jgi:hypothetical protein